MSFEDLAQVVEAQEWERNNQPCAPRALFEPDDDGYGPEFCAVEECSEQMPALRRAMGKHLCTECAALAERRRKLFAA